MNIIKKGLLALFILFSGFVFVSCNQAQQQTATTTSIATTTNNQVNYNFSITSADTSKYKKSNGYTTGNYFETSLNSKKLYGIYRGVFKNDTDIIALLEKPNYSLNSSVEPLESSFYDIISLGLIKKMKITYRLPYGKAKLYTSADKNFDSVLELDTKVEYSSVEFDLNDIEYFKICATNSTLYLREIQLATTNEHRSFSYLKYDGFRINPATYSSALVSGVTKRSIPTKITPNNDTYTIASSKEYTYYDQYEALSYLELHGKDELYDEMVLTNPVDVANYYMLFNTWPVNYMNMDDALICYEDDAYSFMKDDIRCVSAYSRTNGYVKTVPLNMNNGNILYYELDLKLDNYSPNSRSVGRLVVFTNGFDSDGYSNSPVIVYTDDHYATFKEYNNAGEFLERFNAEINPTSYYWSNVKTLSLQN